MINRNFETITNRNFVTIINGNETVINGDIEDWFCYVDELKIIYF